MSSDAQESNELKPRIEIDPDGDLVLRVGPSSSPQQLQDILVDSRAVCRASKAFRTMLRGGFSESQPTDGSEWVVELPEDDPVALSLLMDLVHAQYKRAPAKLSTHQLYDICVLVNKYDVAEVLRPVADRWFDAIRDQANDFTDSHWKFMFVAWELGYADALGEAARDLALHCYMGENGDLLVQDRVTGHEHNLNEIDTFRLIPILDCIADYRWLALQACHEECQKVSNLLVEFSPNGRKLCRGHEEEEVYHMMGKILVKANGLGVLDLFSPGGGSMESLSKSLMSLEDNVRQIADSVDICGWCSFLFDMMDEIRDQCHGGPDPLLRRHLDDMKVQAAKVRIVD